MRHQMENQMIRTRYLIVVNVHTTLVLGLGTTRHIDRAANEGNPVRVCGSDLAFLRLSASSTQVTSDLISYLVHISRSPTFSNGKLNWNILTLEMSPAPGCILGHPVVV